MKVEVDPLASEFAGTHPRFLDKGATGGMEAVGDGLRRRTFPATFLGRDLSLSTGDFKVDDEGLANGLVNPGTDSLNVNGKGIDSGGC
jgi:hypothetical protein